MTGTLRPGGRPYVTRSFSLGPNESDKITVRANMVRVLDLAGDLKIAVGDDGHPSTIFAGVGFETPPDADFLELFLQAGAAGASGTLAIGDRIFDDRLSLSSAVNLSKATSFATGTKITLAAGLNQVVFSALSTRRRGVIRSLPSNTGEVWIQNGSGLSESGHALFPGEQLEILNTDTVRGYVPGASDVVVSRMEERD